MKTWIAIAVFGMQLLHAENTVEEVFLHPPATARPTAMWMWMGSNITREGITRDLEALHDAGLGGTLMFSLADTTTPWPRDIAKAPTPEVIAFTAPWWKLVRHAAMESRRLGLDFGMSNCPGYSSSGGPWIKPEYAMQEVVWSETRVAGGKEFSGQLPRPTPDLRGIQRYPVWNPENGKLERPEHPERRSFFRDIAALALPAKGPVNLDQVIDLTKRVDPDGKLRWTAPPGEWILYRFGHTVMGPIQQPPQWQANGFECDKLSPEAVSFHVNHIIDDARPYVGEWFGKGFNFYHFDSYESWMPRWTPRMREEFSKRRGYDPIPFLPTLAKREIDGSARTAAYNEDFKLTVADLFRENYFPVIARQLRAAGLRFSCEPYGGPWKIPEVTPFVDRLLTEFWTHGGNYHRSGHLLETVQSGIAAGFNPIAAEAFTGQPDVSQWSETPAWLKSIGDEAFCDGINHLVLHRYTHQPWGDRHKPGVVMGRWGTHFDHTQTWWEPGKAWIAYLTRCQALLQWGKPAPADAPAVSFNVTGGQPKLRAIHRKDKSNDVFFVANTARVEGTARVRFPVADRLPELWHPVTGGMRPLNRFQVVDGGIEMDLEFAPSESIFVVFRSAITAGSKSANDPNFQLLKPVLPLDGVKWTVAFDPKWGGPASVGWDRLVDWKDQSDPGIKYYSGTATYSTTFTADESLQLGSRPTWLDLGVVRDIASVRLNGRDLGVIWTAPWRVDITAALRTGENQLEIRVTNCWANRLIGDEQQPADSEWNKGDMGFGGPLKAFPEWVLKDLPRPSKGRYTFTTWNYFTAQSPLLSSGLLGPVRVLTSP